MKIRVAALLETGFEEAEAMVVIDVLNRVGIQVDLLACTPEQTLHSYHRIQVTADALLSDKMDELYDAIFLPGGPDGARNLGKNANVIEYVKRHQAAGKYVLCICSAAAHVLSANKLLGSKTFVSSGDNHKLYSDGTYHDAPIVVDGQLITCKGLGYAFDFGFHVATTLVGPALPMEQAEHVYYGQWPNNENVFVVKA